jgi:hypothetical protein
MSSTNIRAPLSIGYIDLPSYFEGQPRGTVGCLLGCTPGLRHSFKGVVTVC